VTPLAKSLAKSRGIDLKDIEPSGFLGEIRAKDVMAARSLKATPLSRKIASAAGVQLKDVSTEGTRITSNDVKALIEKAKAS